MATESQQGIAPRGSGFRRRTALKGAGAASTLVAGMLGMAPRAALAQYGAPAGKVFQGAWPYDIPEAGGHYNTFPGIPRSFGLGIYGDLIEMPLGMYYWASDKWMPLLATEWNIDQSTNSLTVKLRQGVKWSDGSSFTSRDVADTFDIRRLLAQVEWRYLDRVEVKDEYTVNFVMAKPSTVVERYVIRAGIRATSVYASWADRARQIVQSGQDATSDAWKKLRQDFTDFKPKGIVATGPFLIDQKSITDAELTLVKNPSSWAANKIAFDKIRLFNGETPTVTPIVLSKEVDYATHGFPPATEKAFIESGIRIFRPPTYAGPALYFNFAKVPAIRPKAVRQAIAFAVKREIGAAAALGLSAEPPKYMVGFSDRLVPNWLTQDTLSKVNKYEYNLDTAEQLMLGAGYKRAGDGVWVSPDGDRMENLEITVPAEYADNSAVAQATAEQMTAFGIKTAVRLINFQQLNPETWAGNFQMIIQGWASANPHPHFSFSQNFQTYNPPVSPGPGMAFPFVQQVDALGGEVDLDALTVKAAEGLDKDAQKVLVNQLALAYNELLPQIPLYERLGNNPTIEGVRVKGWPKDGDPIYDNSPYADSFVTMLMLEGRLQPA